MVTITSKFRVTPQVSAEHKILGLIVQDFVTKHASTYYTFSHFSDSQKISLMGACFYMCDQEVYLTCIRYTCTYSIWHLHYRYTSTLSDWYTSRGLHNP